MGRLGAEMSRLGYKNTSHHIASAGDTVLRHKLFQCNYLEPVQDLLDGQVALQDPAIPD